MAERFPVGNDPLNLIRFVPAEGGVMHGAGRNRKFPDNQE